MFKTVRAVSRAIENVRIAYRFLILNFCHSILFRISIFVFAAYALKTVRIYFLPKKTPILLLTD